MIENTMLSASSLEDACEKKSPPKVSFFGGEAKKGPGEGTWVGGQGVFFLNRGFARVGSEALMEFVSFSSSSLMVVLMTSCNACETV